MVGIKSILLGGFVEDSFVYRQSFFIRSYEVGPDKTATMETLMNLDLLNWQNCHNGNPHDQTPTSTSPRNEDFQSGHLSNLRID